jgi:hypothetical protein
MKRLLPLALAALVAGCSTIPRYEAANDIHAFLVSIRDGDKGVFDAHVDRAALKTNLRARLIAEAAKAKNPLAPLAAMAAPLVEFAVDAAVRPEVFRSVAVQYGYDPAQPIPNALVIGQYVRPEGDGRACVVTRKKGPCVFVFKDEGGVYKLIDFEGHINLDKGRIKMSE